MKTVFDALTAAMDAGEDCVLVSAVGGRGSVPRKTRAHMLVTPAGRRFGTVGGGAIEGYAIRHGMALIAQQGCDLRTFELRENDAQRLGMVCGGEVTLHFQYISAQDMPLRALAQRAAQLVREGREARLVIGLKAHTLSLYDGETVMGAPVARSALAHCAMAETDDVDYYAERLTQPGRVYIFGGGHVAQALVPVLASVDFRCVVLEDRAEFADPALFPAAQEVLLLGQEEWESRLHVTQEDYVCIMTRGHKNDLACQAFALRTPATYIGVIGSRRKVADTSRRLRELGFVDEEISRLISPIGLAIGAQTPAEIAVSVAAQMIMHRAQRTDA